MPTRIPLAPGDIFGRLTVVTRAVRPHYWVCRCNCGSVTTVWKYSLTTGNTRSCGCFRREDTRTRFTTHGRARTPEHIVWGRMIQRCTNSACEDFPEYGGRGIAVCERWRNFENFFADMGARPSRTHSLNRLDNARGYEPGNVVWATPAAQGRNKRNNHYLTFQGQTLTIAEWVERTGLTRSTVNHRLRRGWSVERLLTTR